MTLETWAAFLAASFLISLSPGAGVISCMAAGLRYGLARGVWNVFGLIAGILLVLVLVSTGLGALLAASAAAFTAVKWAGAAYLVGLGVAQWRSAARPVDPAATVIGGARRELFARGFLVNATNPKGIVFMLAVLPQFIDPARPLVAQYAACAGTIMFTDLVVMTAYTASAAKALRLLRRPGQIRAVNRTFGGVLVAMGALLATFKRAA
ncbi:MAG TPA: LysE family transporter [Casimicrobiaceae bacterium]|nr:LysE family transporter [Casimicrobiaceae bacterium]